MLRLRWAFWTLMALLLAVAGGLAVVKYRATRPQVRAVALPRGDQEIAWFHTATNFSTWERFVTGVQHFRAHNAGWEVDESRAYPDRSTDVPEVTIRRSGANHFLRVRWYKQSSQAKVEDWVRALAERDVPPLALIGGGSTDRAVELAETLNRFAGNWKGPRPLLLITTATANTYYGKDYSPHQLVHEYDGRTLRFCFNNKQMAEAVLDFVWWKKDELRPYRLPSPGLGIVAGAGAADEATDTRPTITALEWGDDPYSVDLVEQFRQVQFARDRPPPWERLGSPPPLFQALSVASSVGSFARPNKWEARAAEQLLEGPMPHQPLQPLQRPLPRHDGERALLILPTVPQPARRVLNTLTGSVPGLGQHLIVVNGDGISFNHVYRDRDLIWNMRHAPVPLVFFTHQNPVAWDARTPPAQPDPTKFALYGPTGTDDVLHFSDMVRVLAEAAFDVRPSRNVDDELLASADDLLDRLTHREPPVFDADGNRRGGSGEYVVYLRPAAGDEKHGAALEVWTRSATGWQPVPPRLELTY